MSELLKKKPKPLPKKEVMIIRKKIQKTISSVGGEWFINKMNSKRPTIKRRRLR